MGFIGFRLQQEGGSDQVVRIYLECREEDFGQPSSAGTSLARISYTYAVDVVYPGGQPPCRLRGVDGILVLKKFYKLVHSLEERARERGNDWERAMESAGSLVEHLNYTRNARDFTGQTEPKQSLTSSLDSGGTA